MLLCKCDERTVTVDGGDLSVRVPAMERARKCAGTATDLEDLQRQFPVQIEQVRKLRCKSVVETKLTGVIQRFFALYKVGPDGVQGLSLPFICKFWE